MAEGCVLLSRDQCNLKCDIERIYSSKASKCIAYDGKRLKWQNSLKTLQDFFENSLDQRGKWSSPGGSSRKFVGSSNDLVCTWYCGRQNTLMFQGESGNQLRYCLIQMCVSTNFGGI